MNIFQVAQTGSLNDANAKVHRLPHTLWEPSPLNRTPSDLTSSHKTDMSQVTVADVDEVSYRSTSSKNTNRSRGSKGKNMAEFQSIGIRSPLGDRDEEARVEERRRIGRRIRRGGRRCGIEVVDRARDRIEGQGENVGGDIGTDEGKSDFWRDRGCGGHDAGAGLTNGSAVAFGGGLSDEQHWSVGVRPCRECER